MSTTICVPLNTDGTIHQILGQAPVVATCQVDEGMVTDWVEHPVHWDQTYGVDVKGVHHPRIIRFIQENDVNVVVANDVCESMQKVFATLGVTVHLHNDGNGRAAVETVVPAA